MKYELIYYCEESEKNIKKEQFLKIIQIWCKIGTSIQIKYKEETITVRSYDI
jgi:hypothetical protein